MKAGILAILLVLSGWTCAGAAQEVDAEHVYFHKGD